jgi:hypothetical protein
LQLTPLSENTKLFAICKKSNGWPLRITFFKELAELWTTDTTFIQEARIKVV